MADKSPEEQEFDNKVALPIVLRWCRGQQDGTEPYAPYVGEVWRMVSEVLQRERERVKPK